MLHTKVCQLVLFVFTILVIVHCKEVKFTDCTPQGATKLVDVKTVDITPCNGNPCQVVKGKTSSLNITFLSKSKADNLTASIFAVFGGSHLPYPDPYPNACVNSGIKCPVATNQQYTYNTSLKIPAYAPSMEIIVGFQLEEPNKVPFMCIEVAVQVVAGEMELTAEKTKKKDKYDFLYKQRRILEKKPENYKINLV